MIRWLTQLRRVRVLVDRQLAGREHDLAQGAVDLVAVGVHVREVVVLAHGLELVERRLERAVVPEPGVGERVRLGRHGGRGQRRRPRRTASAPLVEPEREPGHGDVVGDVRLLLRVLVGVDGEPLDRLGVQRDRAAMDATNQTPTIKPERPHPARERPRDEERAGKPRQEGQDVVGEEAGMGVGEGHARRHAPSGCTRARTCRAGSRRRPTSRYSPARTARWTRTRVTNTSPPRVAVSEIARAGHHQQGRSSTPLTSVWTQPEERQLEQEEADVPAEDRVGDRARRRVRDAVDPQQNGGPGPRDRPGDAQRHQQGDAARWPTWPAGSCRASRPRSRRSRGYPTRTGHRDRRRYPGRGAPRRGGASCARPVAGPGAAARSSGRSWP